MTYEQIYRKVWGDYAQDIENNNTMGFHICNLREKLFAASLDAPFTIRCVRNVRKDKYNPYNICELEGKIMKRTVQKLFFVILLIGMIAMAMSGCAYVNNKNWDDLTPGEQEEVRQNFLFYSAF